MKLINVMLGAGRGGLEQAAVDYHEALLMAGHEVVSVAHPRAAVLPALRALGGQVITLQAMGEWDVLAVRRLRRMVKETGAQMVLGHGNRAIGLGLRAARWRVPVVGVAHNYQIKKRFPTCDAAFCITRDLMEEMVHLDMPRTRLFHIPNLIRMAPKPARASFRSPPVVGTLGRFVSKKGMDVLVQAIGSLHGQGTPVRAIIAGAGEQEAELKRLARELGLAEVMSFPGWVEDKADFFASLDVFVLPSHHEPFGIALIEAMAAGVPCITTDTEGPCEIITHEEDALMIEKDRPFAMAHAIAELLEDEPRARRMGDAAYLKAESRYAIEVVSVQLDKAVKAVAALPVSCPS